MSLLSKLWHRDGLYNPEDSAANDERLRQAVEDTEAMRKSLDIIRREAELHVPFRRRREDHE